MAIKVIKGGTLIDGTSRIPLQNAVVVIKDSMISAVGKEGEFDIAEGDVIDAYGKTVMPGLIDCHVHVTYSADPNWKSAMMQPITITALKAARNLQSTLQAGYTTIRDCGAIEYIDVALKKAIKMGLVTGPRLLVSGKVITMTGGHEDYYMPEAVILPYSSGRVADGPDEVRKAAREQLRAGADWIKICSTGGIQSTGDEPGAPQFTVEEIRAAVEEAHAVGKRVASHAHAGQGVKNAVMAGVSTMEHGAFLKDDYEALQMLVEKGVFLVPTIGTAFRMEKYGMKDMPDYAVRKMEMAKGAKVPSFKKAVEAGVKVAMGTDAGAPYCYHGENSFELEVMVRLGGLSPMQAIIASTKTAAEALGLEKQIGTIEPGKLADIIVVNGDPLQNISILQERDNIEIVIKNGKIITGSKALKLR